MEDLGGAPIDFSRHGYRPLRLDEIEGGEIQTVRMRPVAGGILAGRRFVVDPRLGGEDKGAMGPTGMRASDLNLDVSRRLAQLLEASGAEVTLTRDSDETVSTLHRVEVEEKFDAEWFISIGHGDAGSAPKVEKGKSEAGARAKVTHYPTSEMGERLAESIARSIRKSKIAKNVSVAKGTHFVLTHTGSPAVIVEGPSPSAGIEEKLRRPSAAQNEAYAIYCGILETLGLDDDSTGRISVSVSDTEGNAFPGAWLALDGVFNMAAGPSGEFIFSRLLPGDHRLAVYAGRLKLWDGVIPVGPGGETTVAVSPSGPATVWTPAAAKPQSEDE